jgi:uncharacterized protein (TIGR00369 family)
VPRPPEPLRHHDLCFGCGQANLFGLQLELSACEDGSVEGRFFVKQDHQGPPGYAHGGVIAAALDEAMALLLHGRGVHALTARLELDLIAPAAVGSYLAITAAITDSSERRLSLEARAEDEQGEVASARGTFVRVSSS